MKKLVLFLMVVMLATTANAQNMLINPGFETPVLADGEWIAVFPDP